MKLHLEIPNADYAGLKAAASKEGITVHQLLQWLAADLAGSVRSGGSDERDFADNWFRRRCWRGERTKLASAWDRQRYRLCLRDDAPAA